MDPKKKIEYWLDIADYDMQTAHHMQRSNRYLYAVFMCQQAIEKILKALYIQKLGKEAPFSHNLVYLHSLIDVGLTDEKLLTMAELTTYYIEGRYPT